MIWQAFLSNLYRFCKEILTFSFCITVRIHILLKTKSNNIYDYSICLIVLHIESLALSCLAVVECIYVASHVTEFHVNNWLFTLGITFQLSYLITHGWCVINLSMRNHS